MTIVGLVGGIAPESTIDYYRQIIAKYRERDAEGRHPHILITSVNLRHVIQLLEGNRYDELTDVMVAEIERLERAGAAFAAITSNAAHIVFDAVALRSRLPLVSIIEAACAAAKAQGIRRPLLVGTKFLMEARVYPDLFARAGLTVVLPSAADQETVHAKYMTELVAGIFRPETRDLLVSIAERTRDVERADALILGGTEIPPLLRGVEIPGMPVLDTTALHAEAIVQRLTGRGAA